MITLITGTPGAGKTAFALDMMIRQGRLDNSRKLYVHGIPELKVPHEIVTCSSATCDYCSTLPTSRKVFVYVAKKVNSWASSTGLVNSLDLSIQSDADLVERDIEITYKKAEDWYIFAEHGAILFFDEVQNIHRPRNSSSAVPESIAAYEVHRHRGLDFFIITQNPSLIDGNLRALVSRHIHLTATWARRVQYEFPQCKTDLGATVGEGIKSNYKLPIDVFKLYKSASLHTKLDRKKPIVVYFIPVVLTVIFGLVYFEYNKLAQKGTPKPVAPASTTIGENQTKPLSDNGAGEGVRATQGARDHAPVPYTPPPIQFIDMPGLFKKWSHLGISDDDLKFLPLGMCAVASERTVKCKFRSNLSFKDYFTNISCTPDFCFSFLSRIPAIFNNENEQRRSFNSPPPRSPISTPSLPSVHLSDSPLPTVPTN